MASHGWWQTPRLLVAEQEHGERRVTWLELFYDLMFVVVIAELSHYLAGHATPEGLFGFILMFIPTWWLWVGGTFYNARFETQDVSNRLSVFLQMLALGALTLFVHHGMSETSVPFILSFLVARLIIILSWIRAGWHNPQFRPVSNRYLMGFLLAAVILIASIFVEPPLRFGLWAVGIFIDMSTPFFTLPHQARLPRLSNSKLPERYGLFVIIVLGEQIVGTISGAAEQEQLAMITLVTAALGVGFAFCIWWIYFDFLARRAPRPNVWALFSWSYLHMPLVMSIAALGAGSLILLADATAPLTDSVRWLFTGATAVALLSMACIEVTLHNSANEITDFRISEGMKVLGAVVALGLGAFGEGIGRLPLLGLLLIPFFIQMVYGVYVWYNRDEASLAAEHYHG
jgi:low temperature requirement protein LtrA